MSKGNPNTSLSENVHCCEDMNQALADGRAAIRYSPKVREYSLPELGPESLVIHLIQFCPWCGDRLPTPLRRELFNEVHRLLGIEANISDFHDRNPDIPQEFFTDEWWRKRGL